MKVLIVNTSENTGGAAVASRRLLSALNKHGVSARMLVRDRSGENPSVVTLPGGWPRWNFLWERFVVFCRLHFSKRHLWEVDIANAGSDITRLEAFREADVIHLEWINQGMLSLESIRRILAVGKPVVWTMHDLWPATGICHYARGCEEYYEGCRHCPLLPNGGGSVDLSSTVWNRKQRLYKEQNMHFVTCSKWLEKQAAKSKLLKGCSLSSIPNPIDTDIFRPQDKTSLREALSVPQDKCVILFAAQKVTDERKGARYFVAAIKSLVEYYPQVASRIAVALLGGHADELAPLLPVPVCSLGYVQGEENLSRVYAAADVFVLPSMEDNLPNTIMEAMACGIPCVGFNVGGIPEMIDHNANGYVARAADAADLAKGIACVLDKDNYTSMSRNARVKVMKAYSEESVAEQYVNVYKEVMERQK